MMSKSQASFHPEPRPRAKRGDPPLVVLPNFWKASAERGKFEGLIFADVYQAGAFERVRMVKEGVPASFVEYIAKHMSMPKERLAVTLGLARATVDRKVRENKSLSTDESSRVLGMARLVGQVEAMIEESGNPEGFNAAEWVSGWLEQPLAALGGRRPAELMDSSEGQELVAGLIARIKSGAYA